MKKKIILIFLTTFLMTPLFGADEKPGKFAKSGKKFGFFGEMN